MQKPEMTKDAIVYNKTCKIRSSANSVLALKRGARLIYPAHSNPIALKITGKAIVSAHSSKAYMLFRIAFDMAKTASVIVRQAKSFNIKQRNKNTLMLRNDGICAYASKLLTGADRAGSP